MPITIEEKQKYIKKFGKNAEDTGSSEVQIAILTHRIRELTDHVKTHKKDHHTRRGLVQLVSKRKRLLKYLMRSNAESYVNLIKELSIRGQTKTIHTIKKKENANKRKDNRGKNNAIGDGQSSSTK